jgi:polyisoprenoid-binding protein YceI
LASWRFIHRAPSLRALDHRAQKLPATAARVAPDRAGTADAGKGSMDTRDAARYVPAPPAAAAKNGDVERWDINVSSSRFEFFLRHLVFARIEGRFRTWGGAVYVNRAEPWLSSARVWIDLASIETDDPQRDAHVRSPEFLDVARHPRAEFQSTSIEPRDGRLLMRGRLSLHGVTRDLEIEIEPRLGLTDARNAYVARAKLNRQAFGLHWNQDLDVGGVVLGDEVELHADVAIVRANGGGT